MTVYTKFLTPSQTQLAECIGVDTQTVSRLERGSNLPSLQRLEKLADALSVPLYQLIAASSPRADDQSFIINEWISVECYRLFDIAAARIQMLIECVLPTDSFVH